MRPEYALGAVALTLLFVVVVVVVVVIGLGAAAYFIVRQIRGRTADIAVARAALDALATRPGWRRVADGAEGAHQGVSVKVTHTLVKRGANRNLARLTDTVASFSRPLGLGLSLSRKGPLGFLRLPPPNPAPIVTLGDPAFDATFECRASDAARALALLRHLAPELLDASRVTTFFLDDDTAQFRDEEWALDRAAIDQRIERLASIVLDVERALALG